MARRAVQTAGMVRAGVFRSALVFPALFPALVVSGRMAKHAVFGEVHRLPPPTGGT
jgi:hypothetical protein